MSFIHAYGTHGRTRWKLERASENMHYCYEE